MNYSDAAKIWNVDFPDSIDRISDIQADKGVIVNNKTIHLPWPPLEPDEIANAKNVTEDWQIKSEYIPIMGDFHDLVCLDYSSGNQPEVVIINDDREELKRFKSLDKFLNELIEIKEDRCDISGIIEKESWLDI